ncbi:MAG: signal peptidase I [Candidatus Bathyarchaeia archaeon]
MSEKLKKIRRLWDNGLFRSFIMLIILLLCVLAFQRILVIILKTEYPLTTPETDSMTPTIKVGDLLIVQGGLRGEDIHASQSDGDIIVFKDPRNISSKPIVHRAIEKYYNGSMWLFRTKGDKKGLPADPWWVPESYIYGKVIFIIPYLGYIKIYLGNEFGMMMIIILLVILLIFENLDLIRKKNGGVKSEPD